MSATVYSVEDADFVTLIWNHSGNTGEVISNSNGVTVEHVTRVTQGAIEFRFDDRTVPVLAGQEITLPLRRGYDVVITLSPAEVRCLYPRAAVGGDELEHLRSVTPKSWDTYSGSREVKQIDTSAVRTTGRTSEVNLR